MRYMPGNNAPYTVFVKGKYGWIQTKSFADKTSALAEARSKSLEPDLPYKIQFENGEIINSNETEI